uniref:Uncharacterized protein n=1 Tax=Anguilla anguilla TaxID=7936 RepID=A0A0E9WME8_ANGAN
MKIKFQLRFFFCVFENSKYIPSELVLDKHLHCARFSWQKML